MFRAFQLASWRHSKFYLGTGPPLSLNARDFLPKWGTSWRRNKSGQCEQNWKNVDYYIRLPKQRPRRMEAIYSVFQVTGLAPCSQEIHLHHGNVQWNISFLICSLYLFCFVMCSLYLFCFISIILYLFGFVMWLLCLFNFVIWSLYIFCLVMRSLYLFCFVLFISLHNICCLYFTHVNILQWQASKSKT